MFGIKKSAPKNKKGKKSAAEKSGKKSTKKSAKKSAKIKSYERVPNGGRVSRTPHGGTGRKKVTTKAVLKGIWNFIKFCVLWLYHFTLDVEKRDSRRKHRILGRTITFAGFIVTISLLIVFLTTILINRTVQVEKEQMIITGLQSDLEGYRILLISDLNDRFYGQDQSSLMRKLSSEKYDCVLLAGDMVGKSGSTDAFYALLEQLGTKKPVYFIAGDNDPSPLMEIPRDNSSETLTLRQMVLSDWVLGAIERGAIYLDTPQKITKGSATMWLIPDLYLNLNVGDALDEYKEELAQESESYLEGVERSKNTVPLTNYRRNNLYKSHSLISSVTDKDLVIMLSHEVPSDAQITDAVQTGINGSKDFFPAPDLVLSGHYCGGEWKLPFIGSIYVSSNILPRYGWFPDRNYVEGQRTVGSVSVYTTAGLSNNGDTLFFGRLNNPPKVSILTLTGELPASFLD